MEPSWHTCLTFPLLTQCLRLQLILFSDVPATPPTTMARSFKISFPLPRRPSASPSTATPGSRYSNQSNHDDSPILHPGSKAERTLGASEPDRSGQKKMSSRKERRQLRKSPSFMSVTLSEIDGESVQASDGFPSPGMQTRREPQRPPTQYLSRQGSSPLLGELYYNGSTNTDNMSNATASQAHRADSSSTLRSHYDPQKVPLPISQQTSASSARDMALRKGFPPISGPSGLRKVDGITPADALHLRSISGESRGSASSKLSGNSIKRINGIPRRRPSVTDPPTLYPNADRASHAVSPPPALMNSTLPKTLPPNTLPTRPKWWQRKTSSPEVSPPIPFEGKMDGDTLEENFSSIKANVKKPKGGVTGNRNWFDGLEDEEQTLEDLQHPETSGQSVYEKSEPPLSIYEIVAQEARPSQLTSRKSSFSNKSQKAGPSDRKLSFRLDSPPYSDTMSSPPQKPSGNIPNSPQAKSIQTATSSRGPHSGMDLQVESFLELSSSEDEGGESSALSELQEPTRRHRIRASIERNSYNNEVSVGNAQRAQPVRPRSILNRTSSRPLSKRSTSSEFVPPVPRIPNGPRLNQRTSSRRWREIMEEKAASTESTIDSGASSYNENANVGRGQPTRTKKKQIIRGSKLMKVTSEEENLLEAMRDKRASIAQDDFEKGFKTAMQLQDIVARPKTAGADGRTSRSSTLYGSRSSISPPPQDYGLRKQLAGSRLSASADDLLLDDAYPFPEVPPRQPREGTFSRERVPPSLKSPMDAVSPSKASPSLSFGPSDILPSTPASRNSPLTPPPGHVPLGYGRSSPLSPPRSVMAMNKFSHDRKRTISSSVVMLDGVEQHAQQLDEENWAMDRW